MAAERSIPPGEFLPDPRATIGRARMETLTFEQLEASRRRWLRYYGFDDKPDPWWFA